MLEPLVTFKLRSDLGTNGRLSSVMSRSAFLANHHFLGSFSNSLKAALERHSGNLSSDSINPPRKIERLVPGAHFLAALLLFSL